MDFKNQTRKIGKKTNSITQSKIKKYYTFYYVQIDNFENNNIWIKILLKFILIKYNNSLIDWNINQIKQIKKVYSKILKSI